MSKSRVPSAFNDFTSLSPCIFSYESPSPNTSNGVSPQDAPDLILLCAWLDATPRHISKYTSGFQKLFPTSRIIVLMTGLSDFTFRSRTSIVARVSPITDILVSLPPESKLLIAAYSNGGSIPVTDIASEYARRLHRPLPVQAVLLDSAPGIGDWEHMKGLPFVLPSNPIMRIIASAAMYAYIFYYITKLAILGTKGAHQCAWETWNDDKVFEKAMSRLYVASKGDKLVRFDNVMMHCGEARADGWKADIEEFGGKEHVGHAREDPERYWGLVRALWEGERVEGHDVRNGF